MNRSTEPSSGSTTHTDQPWFVQAFGEDYPLLYRHRDEDSARREVQSLMTGLNLPTGARVLDVCCGAGRHMLTLAAMGYEVWGVDLSPNLLRDAAEHEQLAGRLVRGDIRALPFDACFDAAVNLFTSFGYFHHDAQNTQAMRQIVSVVRPGGTIVVDLINRSQLEQSLVEQSSEMIDGRTVVSHRKIVNDRVVKRTVIDSEQGTRELVESVRLYRPDEITTMLNETGVRELRLLGNFDGGPLSEDSPRMIVVGQRA